MGLQWSHDLSAMDTLRTMIRIRIAMQLQWSHDLSAMDTTNAWQGGLAWIASLQWSHDLSAMDTSCAKGKEDSR